MDLTDARIAVIGGAGLIGSHLVDALLKQPVSQIIVFDNFVRGGRANLESAAKDSRVRIAHGSITDRTALSKHLHGINGVFLLASLWLGECLNDPRSAWETGVMGTWNVIE